jgi:plasmid maintenance system antidote protein VapI
MSRPYFGLESFPHLTFRDLQDRLISLVVTKIRNGEFTERRLARVLGVSQPQLHNVLKGVRPLKPEFADCLLRQFNIGILDLALHSELSTQLEAHEAQCVKLWLELAERTETAPSRRKPPGEEISDTRYVRRLAS